MTYVAAGGRAVEILRKEARSSLRVPYFFFNLLGRLTVVLSTVPTYSTYYEAGRWPSVHWRAAIERAPSKSTHIKTK